MKKLDKSQLDQVLASLPGWSVEGGKLHKVFVFDDFVQAFGFMSTVALAAESMDHHPDWSNSYKRVTIDLVTHSAGGITAKDVELAGRIEELVGRNPANRD